MCCYIVFICPNCGGPLKPEKDDNEKICFDCPKENRKFYWETISRCSKLLKEEDLGQAPIAYPKHIVLLDFNT